MFHCSPDIRIKDALMCHRGSSYHHKYRRIAPVVVCPGPVVVSIAIDDASSSEYNAVFSNKYPKIYI